MIHHDRTVQERCDMCDATQGVTASCFLVDIDDELASLSFSPFLFFVCDGRASCETRFSHFSGVAVDRTHQRRPLATQRPDAPVPHPARRRCDACFFCGSTRTSGHSWWILQNALRFSPGRPSSLPDTAPLHAREIRAHRPPDAPQADGQHGNDPRAQESPGETRKEGKGKGSSSPFPVACARLFQPRCLHAVA